MAENEKDQPVDEQAPDTPETADEQAEDQTDSPAEEEAEDDLPPIEYTVDEVGPLRKKLTVTVPAERIAAKQNELIGQLSDTVQVPGFRIGRAPRRLIEKRYGTELADDAKAQLVAGGYQDAIEKSELKILGEPDFDQEKLNAIEMPEDGPMTFDVEVEVQPEFDLPELEGIEVTRPSSDVTDEHVDEAVERWRGNFAQAEPVEEAAKADDVLVADLTFAPEGGEEHKHDNARIAVRDQALEGVPLEGIGKKLTGVKAGDTVTHETEIPEGHPDEALRGKKATFTIAVKEVRRVELPELDDAFVSRLGFDSVDDFRTFVRERLQSEAAQNQQQEMRRQVYAYLLDKTELELPEGVLGRMRERAVQRRYNELLMRGIPRTEIDKHMDELSTTAAEEAARELKSLFVLQKVSEQLEVEVSENDVNALISQMAQQYGRRPDSIREELEKRNGMLSLYQQVQEQKAVDQLLEKAKVTDAPDAPADEEEKADDEEKPKKTTKKKAKKKAAKKSSKKKADDAGDDMDAT